MALLCVRSDELHQLCLRFSTYLKAASSGWLHIQTAELFVLIVCHDYPPQVWNGSYRLIRLAGKPWDPTGIVVRLPFRLCRVFHRMVVDSAREINS